MSYTLHILIVSMVMRHDRLKICYVEFYLSIDPRFCFLLESNDQRILKDEVTLIESVCKVKSSSTLYARPLLFNVERLRYIEFPMSLDDLKIILNSL